MEEGKIKKGNFFFLVFLLAAAVVIGSTIGLISNLNYIVHKTEVLKEKPPPEHSEMETAAETESESTDPDAPADNTASNTEASVPSTQAVRTSANSNFVDIGADERQLLKDMLYNLGMRDGDNFNDFVRSFQNKNSLHATGNIDYQTLNAIIQQSTMKEVSRSINEGINT